MTLIKLRIENLLPQNAKAGVSQNSDIVLELNPLEAQTIASQLQHLYTMSLGDSFLSGTANIDLLISGHLNRIGIPSGLSGYRYLLSAIRRSIEDESLLDAITKMLYPEIAQTHNSTPQRVEKSIRHAIKTTWDHSTNLFSLEEYHFHIKKGRTYPTNTQFIAEICRKIRLTLKN